MLRSSSILPAVVVVAASVVLHGGAGQTAAAEQLPFTLTKTGLLFLLEPYIAGPYSEGTFKVPLAYKEIPAPFKLKGK